MAPCHVVVFFQLRRRNLGGEARPGSPVRRPCRAQKRLALRASRRRSERMHFRSSVMSPSYQPATTTYIRLIIVVLHQTSSCPPCPAHTVGAPCLYKVKTLYLIEWFVGICRATTPGRTLWIHLCGVASRASATAHLLRLEIRI